MTTLTFLDAETLGLDARRHPVWEIAAIRRTADGAETEHLWQIRPRWWQLRRAESEALTINRFRERFAVPAGARAADMLAPGGAAPMTLHGLREAVRQVVHRAVLVGSNPGFDAARLALLLGDTPWHYRPIDVATLAAGAVYATRQVGADAPRVPYSSRALSRAVGVEPPGDDVAHTALADARWARDVYDAVVGGAR